MSWLLALCLLCAGPSRADDIPEGPPPEAFFEGVPPGDVVTPFILERYGLTVAEFQALPAARQREVKDWIRIGEWRSKESAGKRGGLPWLALSPVPPAPKAALAAAPKGFTLNAESLKRYGWTLDRYNAMPPEQRRRVADWIELAETDRELRESMAGREPPKLKLDPKVEAALARLRAGLAPDFDARGRGGPGAGAIGDWVPSLTMRGPADVNGDAYDYTGTLRRFSMTDPAHGLTLSAGLLGADGVSPLVESSPYAGLEKSGSGSGGTLDWSGRASAYALSLGARLYPNGDGPVDQRIGQGISTFQGIAPDLGLDPAKVQRYTSQFSYSSGFERDWIFMGGLLGRVGRAYRLAGDELRGIDWGWSAMGDLRVSQFFPNASLDQTAGLRLRPDPSHGFGLFAGVTEGIGLFSKSVVSDSLAADSLKTDVHPDAAPHVSAAAWGKMPYLSGVEYSVSGGQQWNPWTTVRRVDAALEADAGKGVKVGVFGSYSNENGADIEYDRTKGAGGVMVKPNANVGISAQYFNQSASFGDARVNNQGALLSLTVTESAPGGGPGASITLESLFGGRDQLLPSQTSSQMVKEIQGLLDIVRNLKDAGVSAAGGAGPGWQALQNAWSQAPPEVRGIIDGVLRAEGAPTVSGILSAKPSTIDSLNKLVDLLSDTRLIERMIVLYLRHQILSELKTVEIPVLGRVRLSAPLILAAANAYSLGLTPVPPITAADARGSLDAFLLNKLDKTLGCGQGAQPQSTTDCLLSQLPKDEVDKIRSQYGGDINAVLKTAIQWPSDVVRREMNQLGLQIVLAAEQLDELNVDKGERIGDMNVRGLMDSFQYLDERERKREAVVLKAAADDLREDLAAQDAAIRGELTEYGAARLAWLQAQPAWPAGVQIVVAREDWAGLLAVYGDKALFGFILKCKAALAAKGGARRLRLTLDRVSPLGGIVVSAGDPAEVRLPPKPVDLDAFALSF